MKIKRYLLRMLFIVIILLLLIVSLFQYRHFYKVGDMVFTFWKTGNGCYIMPYKYLGLIIPKNNYMKASNLGGIVIFIGEESTLHIFPEMIYERGADKIECNLPSYKYEYYPYVREIESVLAFNEKIAYFKNCGYPYIGIYIREMSNITQSVD